MMLFKERKDLEAEFQKWAEENYTACSVFNAITWLVEVKGYRQPEPPRKELICQITIPTADALLKAIEEVVLDGKTLAEWLELVKGYKQLEAELAAVKRERAALLFDLSRRTDACAVCEHGRFRKNDCKELFDDYGCAFEWRGVCPENTGVHPND